MAAFRMKVIVVLLLASVAASAGLDITQKFTSIIDAKSEKKPEDLVKIQASLKLLNSKIQANIAATGDITPHLKKVLALKLGEKNVTLVDESAINKAVRHNFIGGDIALNTEQAAALVAAGAVLQGKDEAPNVVPDVADAGLTLIRAKRGYQTNPKYFWDPAQPIPYFFDSSLSASTIAVIRQGIAFWQNTTCLNFVENPNGASSLRFFNGAGCYSSIGKQGTATQDVSIGAGCNNLGTVTHEINHAIGFYHTMSRPDRDNSVSINYANIAPNEQYNFVKNAVGTDNSFGTPYDYGSVMEYNGYAFAVDSNTPTIVALNPVMENTMGQRVAPAFSDIKQVNKAFSCDTKACPQKTCSNGGFANSKNCNQCVCPLGFGGPSCDTVATGNAPVCNGGTLTATAQPQTLVAAAGTNDYVPYPVATNCFWMIKAPTGRKVVFTLTAAPSSCVQNCVWQGLVVVLGNFDAAGMTMCCPSFIGQPYTATGNLAIVMGYARSHLSNFTFTYNYV